MAPALRIGSHVGQADPIAEASARGADLAQLFLGDPQGWKAPVVQHAGGAEGLRADAEAAGIAIYVHAPYVLNVATTNNRIRIPSRKLLQQHVDLAAEVGAVGLIVHGGHVGKSDDPEVGFDNWRKCVERLDAKVPVLIENTAGGDNAMARRLDRIGRLWEAVSDAAGDAEVGLCLDTCHAHAGGLDLATAVEQVRALTGRIDLVHANDSRDDFDSGADRHANLGSGRIGDEALLAVVRAAGRARGRRDPWGRSRAGCRHRLAARAPVSWAPQRDGTGSAALPS
jgi:deoxyribonuclease-4